MISANRTVLERLIRLKATCVSGLFRKIDWHINNL